MRAKGSGRQTGGRGGAPPGIPLLRRGAAEDRRKRCRKSGGTWGAGEGKGTVPCGRKTSGGVLLPGKEGRDLRREAGVSLPSAIRPVRTGCCPRSDLSPRAPPGGAATRHPGPVPEGEPRAPGGCTRGGGSRL